jgi:outer membrane lipoprotein-sorting protein
MKWTQLFTAAAVSFLGGSPSAWSQTAAEVLGKIDAVMAPELVSSEMSMDVERDGGERRVYVMTMVRRQDKSLLTFAAPPVEKNRKLLRRGDDIWMMLPSVKRPVRVSAKQELMGGDFNNADVLRLSLVRDYDGKIVEDAAERLVIELKAKDRSITYDRVVAEVDRKTLLPLKYEYYTESGKRVKELVFSEVKDAGAGTSLPTRWAMRNLVTGKTSVMTVSNYRPGAAPELDAFSLERLSR